MLYFSKIKIFIIYSIITILSFFTFINFIETNDNSILSKNVNLGLDLQGGSYLLLEVDSTPIINQNLQQKYFGPTGDLYIKRQELIKPIQNKIHDAIQKLATNNKYQIVFDSSSDVIMLYKNNNLDKSDKVLELMGY